MVKNIKRLRSPTKDEKIARIRSELAEWVKKGCSETEIRRLAALPETPIEPIQPKPKRRR